MKTNISDVMNELKPCPCCGNRMPSFNFERKPMVWEGLSFEQVSVRITCACGLQTIPYLIDRRPVNSAGDPGGLTQLPFSAAMNLARIWNSRV